MKDPKKRNWNPRVSLEPRIDLRALFLPQAVDHTKGLMLSWEL